MARRIRPLASLSVYTLSKLKTLDDRIHLDLKKFKKQNKKQKKTQIGEMAIKMKSKPQGDLSTLVLAQLSRKHHKE